MRYPRLITCIIILGVTLLCSLGIWQLSRGHAKQTRLLQWDHHQHRSALQEADLLASSSPERYARVNLSGEFLNAYTFLLDNQIHQGRAGYHVITPFLSTHQLVILVDRGWVPWGRTRDILPTFSPIKGIVNIEGYLDLTYRNPFIKEPIQKNDRHWPWRLQQIDHPTIEQQLNRKIFSMLLKFKSPCPYSFELSPFKGEWLNPARHYGYACQWFLLALTLSILYVRFYRQLP